MTQLIDRGVASAAASRGRAMPVSIVERAEKGGDRAGVVIWISGARSVKKAEAGHRE